MKSSFPCGRTPGRHRGEGILNGCSLEQKNRVRRHLEPPHQTQLNELPVELLSDILSRLPLTFVLQVAKYTCKLWSFVTNSHAFSELHLNQILGKNSGLLYSFRDDSNLYFMDKMLDHNTVGIRLPGDLGDEKKYTMLASCRGLLCYRVMKEESIYVCNPITRDHVEMHVPSFPGIARGFGYAPFSKKYKYVQIRHHRGTQRYIAAIVTLGEDHSWRELDLPSEIERPLLWSCVYCNRSLFWTLSSLFGNGSEHQVMSFDLETEKFRARRIPPIGTTNDFSAVYLAVLEGTIAIVFRSEKMVQEVWMLMDEAQDIWVEKYHFGGPTRMLNKLQFQLEGLWMNHEFYGIQRRFVLETCRSLRPGNRLVGGMRCLSYNADRDTYNIIQLPFARDVEANPFSARLIMTHVGSLVSPLKIVMVETNEASGCGTSFIGE